MKTLTVVVPNRDRLNFKRNISKFFIKSLENQICKDFEVLIVDGGSHNYEDLKEFIDSRDQEPSIRMIQEVVVGKFRKSMLNNIGIRNAKTPYIMTTDVDMFFGPQFLEVLFERLKEDTFIESRTMYWKCPQATRVYKGDVDILNVKQLRRGRIKKRTTCGGCQCCHIDQWTKVRGFDEDFVGWGSEDQDLLTRMTRSKAEVKWFGETHDTLHLFHQPHAKKNIKEDLACQDINKRRLDGAMKGKRPYCANPNGWGGTYDAV